MKPILIYRTEHTPFLHFSGSNGIFSIFGRITVEETDSYVQFFMNSIGYLAEYKKNMQPQTCFFFHIEYLGIHSESLFYDFLGEIDRMNELTELIIIWYFRNEDEEEIGYNFQEYFSELSFKFIEIA